MHAIGYAAGVSGRYSGSIEALNAEQLVTATDRLLLRASVAQLHPHGRKRVVELDRRPGVHRRREPDPDPEQTMYVRAQRFSTNTTLPAVLASAFAIALAVVSIV